MSKQMNKQMSNDEFDALIKLMRGKPETMANKAARAVLVEGVSNSEAMERYGVARTTVSNTVTRYRVANALIRQAYGIGQDVRSKTPGTAKTSDNPSSKKGI